MSNRFILPIVIYCLHFGGRRIRVAQNLPLQRQPGHWYQWAGLSKQRGWANASVTDAPTQIFWRANTEQMVASVGYARNLEVLRHLKRSIKWPTLAKSMLIFILYSHFRRFYECTVTFYAFPTQMCVEWKLISPKIHGNRESFNFVQFCFISNLLMLLQT